MVKTQPEISKVLNKAKFGPLIRIFKNQTFQGALVISLSLLVFLSSPILNIKDSYYSPGDLTQGFTLTTVKQPADNPANPVLSDVAISFHPWFSYNREMIRAGKIPFWNPYNGAGMPYLANYQSAIFSPFNLPFYLLTFRQALIVTAFLKLFALGFFTFLFLKELRVRQVPALIGGIAFMYAGFCVVWVAGVGTAALVEMPVGIYFAEKFFNHFASRQSRLERESQPQRGYLWSLAGFSLSLTAGLLAGHPEIFYFAFLVLGLYILFRLLNLWLIKICSLPQMIWIAVQFGVSGLVAVGLAAFQLVPFLEYMSNSDALAERSATVANAELISNNWPLLFFPDLLGNPSTNFRLLGFPPPEYSSANSSYLGALVLFLGVLSLRFVLRDKYIAFFAGLTLGWVVYAYNLFGLGKILQSVPGLSAVPIWRSQPIMLFAVSCCAALLVNRLYQLSNWPHFIPFSIPMLVKIRRNPIINRGLLAISAIGLLGAGFLGLSLLGGRDLVAYYSKQLLSALKAFNEHVPGEVFWLGASFIAGLLAILGFWLARTSLAKNCLAVILLVIVFLQSGYLLKDYNPTIKDTYFYPVTPAIQKLQQVAGNRTLGILGGDTILPSLNMSYRLSTTLNYDNLGPRRYNQLGQEFFGPPWPFILSKTSEKANKLFGIEYIIQNENLFRLDSGISAYQFDAINRYLLDVATSNQQVVQTFKSTADELYMIRINTDNFNRTNRCALQIKLEQLPELKLIQDKLYPCQQIPAGDNWVQVTFLALPDSKGREYQLTITSPDTSNADPLRLWAKADLKYPDGKLTVNGQSKPGGLEFELYSGNPRNFKLVDSLVGRGFNLYQYTASPTRYYTLSQAIFADADNQVLELIRNPQFDPAQAVILSGTGKPATDFKALSNGESAVPAQIIKEEADSVVLKVTRSSPGYLVLTRTNYPGWKAKVNGVPQPVLRANYAFSAVELESGESTIEYYYEPDSFKLGLIITFATMVSGGLLVALGVLRTRPPKFNEI